MLLIYIIFQDALDYSIIIRVIYKMVGDAVNRSISQHTHLYTAWFIGDRLIDLLLLAQAIIGTFLALFAPPPNQDYKLL